MDHQIVLSILDPDVVLTLLLKANYLVNIRKAKNNLIIHQDCPDFLDTLWHDVLLNR